MMKVKRIYKRMLALILCICMIVPMALANTQTVQAAPNVPRVINTTLPTDDVVIASFHVKEDFGAKGDGTTDDRNAIQSALNAANAAGGGVIYFPAGIYRVTNKFVIPSGVTLRGEWQNPDEGGLGKGTIIKVDCGDDGYDTKKPDGSNGRSSLFQLKMNSAITNMSIWYYKMDYNNIKKFPFAIEVLGDENATIQNVTLINAYQGIKVGPAWNELHYIRNVYGTVLKTGIFIDDCTDVGRLENIHFSLKYWSESGLPGAPTGENLEKVRRYTMATQGNDNYADGNPTGIRMLRSDFEYMYNINVSDMKIGMSVALGTGNGPGVYVKSCGQVYGLNLENCETGLKLDAVSIMGFAISKGRINAAKYGVDFQPEYDGTVQFNDIVFGGKPVSAVKVQGRKGFVSLQNCTFDDWGYNGGSYAVDAYGGVVSVQGSAFNQDKDAIFLGKETLRANILGNTFAAAPKVKVEKLVREIVVDHNPYNFEKLPSFVDISKLAVPKPYKNDVFVATDAPYGAQKSTNAFALAADATEAIQSALNAAAANGGGTVYLPSGIYKVQGTLNVPEGVELRGTYEAPHHTWEGRDRVTGTVLFAYAGKQDENGTPFITLQSHAGIKGFTVYYPEQYYNNIQSYPWTVKGEGTGVYAKNVTLANTYKGVDFGSSLCDEHFIDYVAGCALKEGIFVGNTATRGYVRNAMFNPHYWTRNPGYPNRPEVINNNPDASLGYVWDYQQQNLTFIKAGYSENEYMLGNFAFGARHGIHFAQQDGKGANAEMIGFGNDCAANNVWVESAGTGGIHTVNSMLTTKETDHGIFANEDKIGIQIQGTGASGVTMFNSLVWGNPNRSADIMGGNSVLQQLNAGYVQNTGVNVTGGSVRLQNSFFRNVYNSSNVKVTHIQVGPTAGIVDLTGNMGWGEVSLVKDPLAANVIGADYKPLDISVKPLPRDPGSSMSAWDIAVTLRNVSNSITPEGSIWITEPAAWGMSPAPITAMQPGQSQTIYFRVPVDISNSMVPVKVRVTLNNGHDIPLLRNVSFMAATRSSIPVVIDGSLTEWSDATAIQMGSEQQAANLQGWSGIDDLSAIGYMKWDSSNLYLALDVKDNVHAASLEADRNIQLGDSVQIAVDPARIQGAGLAGWHEFGFALVNGSPVVYRYKGTFDKEPGIIYTIPCSIVRAGDMTRYEIAIPWSELIPVRPGLQSGDVMGISIAINDADENSYKGWMQYMGGIKPYRDPAAFGDLVFIDSVPDASKLASLTFFADRTTLAVGEMASTAVIGQLRSGQMADLSQAAMTYYSTNPEVAVYTGGALQAKKCGSTYMIAIAAMNGSVVRAKPVKVTVTGPGAMLPVSITADQVLSEAGDESTLILYARQVNDVYSFDMTLAYNADEMELLSVAPGDALGVDGIDCLLLWESGVGSVRITGTYLGEHAGITGDGQLVKLRFTRKNADAAAAVILKAGAQFGDGMQRRSIVTEDQNIRPPVLQCLVNGNPLTPAMIWMDSDILNFALDVKGEAGGVAEAVTMIDGVAVEPGSSVELAGALGMHRIDIKATGLTGHTTVYTTSFEVKTSAASIETLIHRFVDTQELGGSLVDQVTNNLKQAVDQKEKGHPDQAVKQLGDILKHLDSKPEGSTLSDKAFEILKTDIEALQQEWIQE